MICPKCHTTLEIQYSFCPNCGVSLHRGGGRILIVTAACVVAMIIGAYGYIHYQLSRPAKGVQTSAAPQFSDTAPGERAASRQEENRGTEADPLSLVNTADLSLEDITGRKIIKAPITLLSPGWFAFPVHACIGAAAWHVTLPSGQRFEVAGGILHGDDPVGLWQLPPGAVTTGFELAPWLPDQPLTWHPLDSGSAKQRILVSGVQYLRDFARIELAAGNAVPGLFMQDGRLVGWSFGDGLRGGYLWTGSRGIDLTAEFYIDDFYRLTFADGREEAFILALADKGVSDLGRLEALAAAHRLETRLAVDVTPQQLRPTAIQALMRDLMLQVSTQDGADDLLSIFDPPTVLAVGSPALATDLVQVAWDQGAYSYALELIEALEEEAGGSAAAYQNLPDLQAAIYRDWLSRLMVAGDQDTASEIYQAASRRFPQDPAIHLVGVELALVDQDWALAERLLAEQRYPAELRDKVRRLRQEIADLKSQEGKIVIRFRPGSRTIPVVARLDRGLNQRFVIDTGASLVTVPSATVRQLGIDIEDNLPRRLFFSATGVQNAVEVTLPSIELNGWVVENVKALVVDLPGQPEVGLLGMNYLNNFRMDVNTSDGLVILAPR